jgi:hypothetical protein
VTNSDPAALNTAIAGGGLITLAFNGTVALKQPLTVSKDTTVDATGFSVILDGGNSTRHFVVTNGVTLRLVNLTLASGHFAGRDGNANEGGGLAQGGSILNAGGTLDLTSCTFASNSVHGGNAGVGVNSVPGLNVDGGAAYGGAIYSQSGTVAASGCTFFNSMCVGGNGNIIAYNGTFGAGGDALGGAIYTTNAIVSLAGVVFTNNLAQGGDITRGTSVGGGGGSGIGGALAAELESSALSNSVRQCVFAANRALGATKSTSELNRTDAYGGALFVGSGSMQIEGTTFTKNLALGGPGWDHDGYPYYGNAMGGAVYNATGQVDIRDSAMVFNQANGGSLPDGCCNFTIARAGYGFGGAIYNKGVLEMTSTTIASNTAVGGAGSGAGSHGSSYGGAIFNSGQATLLNVTAAGDSAPTAPGPAVSYPTEALGAELYLQSGSVALTNTILASVSGETNVWGKVIDEGHNISSDASPGFASATSKNSVDPLLGPVASNGGFTPTLALLFGSPAIGAGDPAACPHTDQRGAPRPLGSGCDIGAFEFSPTVTLTPLMGGTMRLDYQFEPGITNTVSGSTNFTAWVLLGTKVSDTNGQFHLEDPDSVNLRTRFYKVQPVGAQ